MATVNPTITPISDHVVLFSWTLTNANTDGAPIGHKYAEFSDRCVQLSGTFDSATIVIQGSNIAASPSYETLTDPQGNAISKSAAALEQIMECPLWMRPFASGGGASQSVVVTLLARRQRGRP